MKILFLTQTYPRFEEDTAGPFIRDIARALSDGGDEVHVLAPFHPRIEPSNVSSHGIRFHAYRYAPRPGLCLLGYSQSMHADVKLKKSAYALGPFLLAAAHRALTRLCAAGRFDCLNAHWLVPNGVVAAGPARRFGIPLVMSEHGTGMFMAEKNPLFRLLVGRALSRADGITSCSPDYLERRLLRRVPPDAARRTIPYGVDVSKFTPAGPDRKKLRDELGLPQDETIVFAAGRMVYKKGFEFLLRAAGRLRREGPPCLTVIGGDGDLMGDLQALARALGIEDRVLFPGLLYREALPKYYQAADIFAMPSVRDRKGNVDGLPNVVLEAMATGLPIVASDIAGIPLVVADGVNGRLVRPADPDALAAAIGEIAASPEARSRLGRESRRRAEQDLTWAKVAAQYREVYVAAMDRARGPAASSSRRPSA